jgi:hypothetical protein
MKQKQKVDTIIAILLILIGVILLVLPVFNITNIKYLSIGIFALYTILNLIQFILTRKSKDYEGLHSAIGSFIVLSTINIPSSVSEIGDWCFRGCSQLKGNIQIEPNNRTFRTDGTLIFRKDNNEEVDVW